MGKMMRVIMMRQVTVKIDITHSTSVASVLPDQFGNWIPKHTGRCNQGAAIFLIGYCNWFSRSLENTVNILRFFFWMRPSESFVGWFHSRRQLNFKLGWTLNVIEHDQNDPAKLGGLLIVEKNKALQRSKNRSNSPSVKRLASTSRIY